MDTESDRLFIAKRTEEAYVGWLSRPILPPDSSSRDLHSPQSPMMSDTCEPIHYSVGWQKSHEKTQKRK